MNADMGKLGGTAETDSVLTSTLPRVILGTMNLSDSQIRPIDAIKVDIKTSSCKTAVKLIKSASGSASRRTRKAQTERPIPKRNNFQNHVLTETSVLRHLTLVQEISPEPCRQTEKK